MANNLPRRILKKINRCDHQYPVLDSPILRYKSILLYCCNVIASLYFPRLSQNKISMKWRGPAFLLCPWLTSLLPVTIQGQNAETVLVLWHLLSPGNLSFPPYLYLFSTAHAVCSSTLNLTKGILDINVSICIFEIEHCNILFLKSCLKH